jgi:protein phosphatase
MGTTVVAALISGSTLTFATIGDSRIYLVQNHAIQQLTQDDSWLATLRAQEPDIDPAQLEHHPLRHVITKAVGTLADTELTIHERPLVKDDLLLMCSDGLHDLVSDQEMLAITDSGEPLEVRGARLVERALEGGGRDNITALLVRYDG